MEPGEGKLLAGGMGGVAVPIIIEFGAKGARISESIPVKISGAVGLGLGLFTGILPLWKNYPLTKNMRPENKNAVIAFGAANLATGVSIIILDELRKRAAYTFEEVPIGLAHEEGMPAHREEPIKEI